MNPCVTYVLCMWTLVWLMCYACDPCKSPSQYWPSMTITMRRNSGLLKELSSFCAKPNFEENFSVKCYFMWETFHIKQRMCVISFLKVILLCLSSAYVRLYILVTHKLHHSDINPRNFIGKICNHFQSRRKARKSPGNVIITKSLQRKSSQILRMNNKISVISSCLN